jgi:glycerophosphoryl diester phosphodiesterase
VVQDFFSRSRLQVFAHRGGAGLAPENTIAAFDNAVACGADGLELDVHLSKDGVVVVHHDRTLERTTSLAGPLAARTAAELGDAQVPRLSDVLARYKDVPIIIELKVDSEALAHAVVDAVRAAGAVRRVCLGSFHGGVLRSARRIEPAIATSASREETRWALYRSWIRLSPGAVTYGGFQVPEWSGTTRVISPNFVRRAHHAGLAVQVWTVDSEADAGRLLDLGVDALITDRPDVIVPLCKSRR